MGILKVAFHEFRETSMNLRSSDPSQDHLRGEVLFTVEDEDGRRYEGMSATVSAPYGTPYEDAGLEVGVPVGPYKKPIPHNKFAECVERYVRSQIGPQGSGINIQGGKDIKLLNNRLGGDMVCEIEVSELSPAW